MLDHVFEDMFESSNAQNIEKSQRNEEQRFATFSMIVVEIKNDGYLHLTVLEKRVE